MFTSAKWKYYLHWSVCTDQTPVEITPAWGVRREGEGNALSKLQQLGTVADTNWSKKNKHIFTWNQTKLDCSAQSPGTHLCGGAFLFPEYQNLAFVSTLSQFEQVKSCQSLMKLSHIAPLNNKTELRCSRYLRGIWDHFCKEVLSSFFINMFHLHGHEDSCSRGATSRL